MPSPDALRAHISMIPKSEAEAQEPQAFQPISLLNKDMKLLGKILTAVNKYLCQLIQRDKFRFLLGHQAADNVRKAIHLIALLNQRKIPGFLLSLEIYKAFRTLSWDYLRYVLHRWGFGESFLTWLSVLYSSPTLLVHYEGVLSTIFFIF